MTGPDSTQTAALEQDRRERSAKALETAQWAKPAFVATITAPLMVCDASADLVDSAGKPQGTPATGGSMGSRRPSAPGRYTDVTKSSPASLATYLDRARP